MRNRKFAGNTSVERNVRQKLTSKLLDTLLGLISELPRSRYTEAANPSARARELIHHASLKAAKISGALALPPGPLAVLTMLPDLVAIWRLQTQLVSDIAAVFGEKKKLTREAMAFCLFKHAMAALAQDLLMRAGHRILIRRLPREAIKKLLKSVGIKLTHRVLGRGLSRVIPFIGAIGVAGYAYYDTAQVGKNAVNLFSKELALQLT